MAFQGKGVWTPMEKGQVMGLRFRGLTSKGRGHGASLPHCRTVQTAQHRGLQPPTRPRSLSSVLPKQQFTEFLAGWLLHSCTYCYKDDSPHQALGLGIQGRGSEDLHSLDEEVEAQGCPCQIILVHLASQDAALSRNANQARGEGPASFVHS